MFLNPPLFEPCDNMNPFPLPPPSRTLQFYSRFLELSNFSTAMFISSPSFSWSAITFITQFNSKRGFIPTHVSPSRISSSEQEHLKLPIVFIQALAELQLCSSVKHSSLSVRKYSETMHGYFYAASLSNKIDDIVQYPSYYNVTT